MPFTNIDDLEPGDNITAGYLNSLRDNARYALGASLDYARVVKEADFAATTTPTIYDEDLLISVQSYTGRIFLSVLLNGENQVGDYIIDIYNVTGGYFLSSGVEVPLDKGLFIRSSAAATYATPLQAWALDTNLIVGSSYLYQVYVWADASRTYTANGFVAQFLGREL